MVDGDQIRGVVALSVRVDSLARVVDIPSILPGTIVTLFDTTGFTCLGVTVDPLADQQLGGVVMLFAGGVSYLAGGLFLLSRLLRTDTAAPQPEAQP